MKGGVTKAAVLVVVLVSAAAGAAAVTIVENDPAPIAASSGQLNESADLSISGVENVYVGTNVTSVKVTVNDSDTGTSETYDITVTLKDGSGTVLEASSIADVSQSSGSKTTEVSLSSEYSVSTVAEIEVVVEETG